MTLTATAVEGWELQSWSACAGTGACVVVMDGDKTVHATFTELQPIDAEVVANVSEIIGANDACIKLNAGSGQFTTCRQVRVGMDLTRLFKIKTGGGHLKLVLKDGSGIEIGRDSEFEDPPGDEPKGFFQESFELITGWVRAIVRKQQITSPPRPKNSPKIIIETTAQKCGVRGTDVLVEHKPGAIAKTTVTVFDGIVDVTDKSGNVTEVTAGETFTIRDVTVMPWLNLLR